MRAMVYRGPYRIRVEDKPRPLAKARTFAHAETHNFTEHMGAHGPSEHAGAL